MCACLFGFLVFLYICPSPTHTPLIHSSTSFFPLALPSVPSSLCLQAINNKRKTTAAVQVVSGRRRPVLFLYFFFHTSWGSGTCRLCWTGRAGELFLEGWVVSSDSSETGEGLKSAGVPLCIPRNTKVCNMKKVALTLMTILKCHADD